MRVLNESNLFICYSSSLGLLVITIQIIYFEKNHVKIRQTLAKNAFWSTGKQDYEIPVEYIFINIIY